MSTPFSAPQWQLPVDSWDPDPVTNLGNAFITMGDVLKGQLLSMKSALLDQLSWKGAAAVAMGESFAALEVQADQIINSCWVLGEAINFYSMDRSQQQSTESKEQDEEFWMGFFGGLLAFVPFVGFADLGLGALLAGVLSSLADFIAVAGLVDGATAILSEFLVDAGSFVLDSVGADADALPIASWVAKMGDIASTVGKFSIAYTAINATMNAAAAGIAGLPIDGQQESPIPTSAQGAEEMAAMLPFMALSSFAFKELSEDINGVDAPEPEGTGVSGVGVQVPDVDTTDAPSPGAVASGSASSIGGPFDEGYDPLLGGAASFDDTGDESAALLSDSTTLAGTSDEVAPETPSFGEPVSSGNISPMSARASTTDWSSGEVSPVDSHSVNFDVSPSGPDANAGFRDNVADASSSPATSGARTNITADLSHDAPVSSEPETGAAPDPQGTGIGRVIPARSSVTQADGGSGGDTPAVRPPNSGDQVVADPRPANAGSSEPEQVAQAPGRGSSPVTAQAAADGTGPGDGRGMTPRRPRVPRSRRVTALRGRLFLRARLLLVTRWLRLAVVAARLRR